TVADSKIVRKHLGIFSPGEGGNLFAATNKAFIKRFIDDIPDKELLLTKTGINRAEVQRRVKQALLADTLGPENTDLIQILTEMPAESGLGRVAAALTQTAGNLARVNQTPLALGGEIKLAIQDVLKMNSEGLTLKQLLGQGEIFAVTPRSASHVELLEFLSRSPKIKEIRDVFDEYIEAAAKIDTTTGDFFGGSTDKGVLLQRAIQRVKARPVTEEIPVARLQEQTIERHVTQPGSLATDANIEKFGTMGKWEPPNPRSLGAGARREFKPLDQGIENVIADMANGRIEPIILQRILNIIENPKNIGTATSVSWVRPTDVVMQELGLGAISEMYQGAHEARLNALVNMGKRLVGIYKKSGIRKGNEKSQSVYKIVDRTATQADFAVAGQEGIVAADEIRGILKEFADRLGIVEQRRIQDYMPRIFELQGAEELVAVDLASAVKYIGKVEDPFLKTRLGATGYVEDVVGAMDSYTRAAMKYIYLRRPHEQLKGLLKNQAKMPESTARYLTDYASYQIGAKHATEVRLGGFFQKMASMMNMLAGAIPVTSLRQSIKQSTANLMNAPLHIAFRQGADFVRGNMFLGALGGAVDSALTNLSQGINTFSEFGTKVFMRGYREMAAGKLGNKEIQQILKDSNVINLSRWELVQESAPLAIKNALGDKLMFMFQAAENINRSSAYLGVYFGAIEGTLTRQVAERLGLQAGIKATKEAAAAAGRKAANLTQFNYMSTGTPLAFQSPLGKFFGQLGSFPFRQIEFLSPVRTAKALKNLDFANQDVQRIIRYMVGTAVITSGAEVSGLDMRDNVWPIIPDAARPLGFTAGFARFGVGPIPQMGLALSALSRGRAEGLREFKRTLPLAIPGGRAGVRAFEQIREGGGLLRASGLARRESGEITVESLF
ncbi:hypothetical protein LCGC14_0451360, partial [marine sediment metagenome]